MRPYTFTADPLKEEEAAQADRDSVLSKSVTFYSLTESCKELKTAWYILPFLTIKRMITSVNICWQVRVVAIETGWGG